MATNTGESTEAHLHKDDKYNVEKPHTGVQIPIYNDLERISSADLSFGAIIKGTAANPLNTFEKKAALINAELDAFGLGRYQICIWFLCGFGSFLDLAWAQGVGLIASAVYQEMGVADADTGTIFACANAGLALGALFFGLLVDIIGRKWAFNLTCLITSVFGLLLVTHLVCILTFHNVKLTGNSGPPPPSTTMLQSVAFTFLRHSVSEATSQSMLPLLWSFYLEVGAFLSLFSPCGSPLALLLHPPSRMVLQRNGAVTWSYRLAEQSVQERHAARSQAI